jgi:hypothetical protein
MTRLETIVKKIREAISELEKCLHGIVVEAGSGQPAPVMHDYPDRLSAEKATKARFNGRFTQTPSMKAAQSSLDFIAPDFYHKKKPIAHYIDFLERMIKASERGYRMNLSTNTETALCHKGAANAYKSALEALARFPMPSDVAKHPNCTHGPEQQHPFVQAVFHSR